VLEGELQRVDTSWLTQAAREWLAAVHDSSVITPANAPPPPEPDLYLAGLFPRPRSQQEIEQRYWNLGDKVWVFDTDDLGDSAYDGSRGQPLRALTARERDTVVRFARNWSGVSS